ncbi:MAG: hypothetical protein AAF517_14780 [Planctomycetota bacterium]
MDSKYQIESSNYVCGGCEDPVECGASYYSVVVYDESRFARRNYCPSCWGPIQRNGKLIRRAPAMAGVASEGVAFASEAAGAVSEGAVSEGVASEGVASEAGLPGEAEPAEAIVVEYFAYWKTRRPEPDGRRTTKVRFDPELVLEFFQRLIPEENEAATKDESATREESKAEVDNAVGPDSESDAADVSDTEPSEGDDSEAGEVASTLKSDQQRDLRFVIGLLLLRKKVLVFETSAIESGREWLRLSEKESGRKHWIENPELSEEEMERVRDDLGELLMMNV